MNFVKEEFQEKGYVVTDFGCPSEESIDYPDYAHPVANIVEKEGGIGILICGSGNGISMSANKHSGIRCALCWTDEIAALARPPQVKPRIDIRSKWHLDGIFTKNQHVTQRRAYK